MKTYSAAFIGCGHMTEPVVDDAADDPTIIRPYRHGEDAAGVRQAAHSRLLQRQGRGQAVGRQPQRHPVGAPVRRLPANDRPRAAGPGRHRLAARAAGGEGRLRSRAWRQGDIRGEGAVGDDGGSRRHRRGGRAERSRVQPGHAAPLGPRLRQGQGDREQRRAWGAEDAYLPPPGLALRGGQSLLRSADVAQQRSARRVGTGPDHERRRGLRRRTR